MLNANMDTFDLKVVKPPKTTIFNFMTNNRDRRKRIKLTAPTINEWDISFFFHKKGWWIFDLKSDVDVHLKNVRFELEGLWLIDEAGVPKIETDYIDLGFSDSTVEYKNDVAINATIRWGLQAIEMVMKHALNFFGR